MKFEKNAPPTGVFDLCGADFFFLRWAGAGRWRGRGSCGFFGAVATLRPHPSATLLIWPAGSPRREQLCHKKKSTCLCNIMSGSMEYCVANIHRRVTNTYFTLSAQKMYNHTSRNGPVLKSPICLGCCRNVCFLCFSPNVQFAIIAVGLTSKFALCENDRFKVSESAS